MSLFKRIKEGENAAPEDAPPTLGELRLARRPARPTRDAYAELKSQVQKKVIAELDPRMDLSKT
ncbi:MAG: CpaF family protein, partial [Anaerolineae bacterium]